MLRKFVTALLGIFGALGLILWAQNYIQTNPSIAQAVTGYLTIQDEGSNLTQRNTVNFTGAAMTCSDDSGNSRTNCADSGITQAYATVDSNGSAVTQRSTINFIPGTNVTLSCVDNPGSSRTDCTFNSTGGGGGGVSLAQLGVGLASLTDPTGLSWSWFDQGSATITTNGASLVLSVPNSGGNNLQGRVVSGITGTSPYTVTIGMITNMVAQDFQQCGLTISDGTKYITIRYPKDGGSLDIFTWNTFNSPNASPFSIGNPQALQAAPYVFERIKEDSTNRLYQISSDGVNYSTMFTETKQTFLTTTQAGFYCLNNSATQWVTSMTNVHFTNTAP